MGKASLRYNNSYTYIYLHKRRISVCNYCYQRVYIYDKSTISSCFICGLLTSADNRLVLEINNKRALYTTCDYYHYEELLKLLKHNDSICNSCNIHYNTLNPIKAYSARYKLVNIKSWIYPLAWISWILNIPLFMYVKEVITL